MNLWCHIILELGPRDAADADANTKPAAIPQPFLQKAGRSSHVWHTNTNAITRKQKVLKMCLSQVWSAI